MLKKKLRKYLYEDEVEQLLEAAKKTNFPVRDQAIILLMYIHAFRATELCRLEWDHIDFERRSNHSWGTIRVNRQKGGRDFTHFLSLKEYNLLLELKNNHKSSLPYVFITLQDRQFERHGLKMLMRRLEAKCPDLKEHPHLHKLRHAKAVSLRENGVSLENIGDYLGHKHYSSTQIYTNMAENPFFKDINKGSIFA